MVSPVPGRAINPGYRVAGTKWRTCGFHTGQDYAAPLGTKVVAARGGTVVHVNYGSSLGNHQFAIRPGDGTEDVYCHTRTRPANGTKVTAGQAVAEIGVEGNTTGPHLHFERHKSYGWACSLFDDPMKSHNAAGTITGGGGAGWAFPAGKQVFEKFLVWHGHEQNSDGISDSIKAWQEMLNHHSLQGGVDLPITGRWFEMTAAETQKCQTQHVPPADTPLSGVYVGPKQFEHIRAATGCPYVWVESQAAAPPNPTVPPAGEKPPPPGLVYPGSIWDPIPRNSGGWYTGLGVFVGSARKVTLHTTESTVKPPWEAMQSGIPHFTLDTVAGRVWQHLPLHTSAYTMKGGEHSVNTESGINIQIEMIGTASRVKEWTDNQYEQLENMLQWLNVNLGIPHSFPAVFNEQAHIQRMSWEVWEPMSGVLGHQHAPYNDHWDPGPIDVRRLTRDELPPVDPPVVEPPVEPPIDPDPPDIVDPPLPNPPIVDFPPVDGGWWENFWEHYSDFIMILVFVVIIVLLILIAI